MASNKMYIGATGVIGMTNVLKTSTSGLHRQRHNGWLMSINDIQAPLPVSRAFFLRKKSVSIKNNFSSYNEHHIYVAKVVQ